MVKYMAVAVAVAVSGGGAVAVAGLTKRFFNHIQKDFLIDVWVYVSFEGLSDSGPLSLASAMDGEHTPKLKINTVYKNLH